MICPCKITIVLIIILFLRFFPKGNKIIHTEIFKNIDPNCHNYSKKECSMPGKISSKCTISDIKNGNCKGITKIGKKCYDHHYHVCISK